MDENGGFGYAMLRLLIACIMCCFIVLLMLALLLVVCSFLQTGKVEIVALLAIVILLVPIISLYRCIKKLLPVMKCNKCGGKGFLFVGEIKYPESSSLYMYRCTKCGEERSGYPNR